MVQKHGQLKKVTEERLKQRRWMCSEEQDIQKGESKKRRYTAGNGSRGFTNGGYREKITNMIRPCTKNTGNKTTENNHAMDATKSEKAGKTQKDVEAGNNKDNEHEKFTGRSMERQKSMEVRHRTNSKRRKTF